MKRRRKKFSGASLVLLALSLALLCGCLAYLIPTAETESDYVKISDVEVNYTEEGSVITLSSLCYELEFYTSAEQGRSIEFALKGVKPQRPLTHDVIKRILDSFFIRVESARILELKRGIYFAVLDLKSPFIERSLDIRPSDAVAIALRTDAPILVKKELMKNLCPRMF